MIRYYIFITSVFFITEVIAVLKLNNANFDESQYSCVDNSRVVLPHNLPVSYVADQCIKLYQKDREILLSNKDVRGSGIYLYLNEKKIENLNALGSTWSSQRGMINTVFNKSNFSYSRFTSRMEKITFHYSDLRWSFFKNDIKSIDFNHSDLRYSWLTQPRHYSSFKPVLSFLGSDLRYAKIDINIDRNSNFSKGWLNGAKINSYTNIGNLSISDMVKYGAILHDVENDFDKDKCISFAKRNGPYGKKDCYITKNEKDYELKSETINTPLINQKFDKYTYLKNKTFHGDISNVYFSYAILNNISFIDLKASDLTMHWTLLDKVKFNKVNVFKGSFKGQLINSSVTDTDFDKTSLSGVRIINSKFLKSTLNDVDFISSSFINVVLDEVSISSANFEYSTLYNVKFNKCKIENVLFKFNVGKDVTFKNCNFKNVDFRGANLEAVYFVNSTFDNVQFDDQAMSQKLGVPNSNNTKSTLLNKVVPLCSETNASVYDAKEGQVISQAISKCSDFHKKGPGAQYFDVLEHVNNWLKVRVTSVFNYEASKKKSGKIHSVPSDVVFWLKEETITTPYVLTDGKFKIYLPYKFVKFISQDKDSVTFEYSFSDCSHSKDKTTLKYPVGFDYRRGFIQNNIPSYDSDDYCGH